MLIFVKHCIDSLDSLLPINIIDIIIDYNHYFSTLLPQPKVIGCWYPYHNVPYVASFSYGNIVVSCNNILKIWDHELKTYTITLTGHTDLVTCVNVLLDGR